MASRKLTMARSALSTAQKRSILVKEGLRRLSNYSPSLPWSKKVESLNLFCIDMFDCGHKETFRANIMRRVIGKFKKNLEYHNQGFKNMFRRKREICSIWRMVEEKASLTGSGVTRITPPPPLKYQQCQEDS